MGEQTKGPNPQAKLLDSVKKFLSSYKSLNPMGRNIFYNQIESQMLTMDKRTKKLYEALLAAAKKGLTVDQTIKEMEKSDPVLFEGK